MKREGHRVHFLASGFTAAFVRSRVPDTVIELGNDLAANQLAWARAVREVRPTAVVFADYPLLTFSSGTVPLRDQAWEAQLDRSGADMFTLDHLGYAQQPRLIFFGPAHRTIGVQRVAPIPPGMQVLLPCPLHDPATTQLRGLPFQYWEAGADTSPSEAAQIRRRYLRSSDELLILHCTSGWACRAADLLRSPYYAFLPRLLSFYLADLPRPVTVLSVNTGTLLPETTVGHMRIVNLGPVPPAHFEHLLSASDLVMTENRISVSLAKAIHLRKPCAVLRNSRSIGDIMDSAPAPLRAIARDMERACLGSVFPFDVFPIWAQSDLEDLGIFDEDGARDQFVALEIFGGEPTAEILRNLLTDGSTRDNLQAAQRAYLARVRSLPSPVQVLDATHSHQPGHTSGEKSR
jgi:Family of unknown function (DUF6365)